MRSRWTPRSKGHAWHLTGRSNKELRISQETKRRGPCPPTARKSTLHPLHFKLFSLLSTSVHTVIYFIILLRLHLWTFLWIDVLYLKLHPSFLHCDNTNSLFPEDISELAQKFKPVKCPKSRNLLKVPLHFNVQSKFTVIQMITSIIITSIISIIKYLLYSIVIYP